MQAIRLSLIRLEVIKHDQEQVFGIRNELVGSGMVLRTRKCMVRVAEGHGHDTVWHYLALFEQCSSSMPNNLCCQLKCLNTV